MNQAAAILTPTPSVEEAVPEQELSAIKRKVEHAPVPFAQLSSLAGSAIASIADAAVRFVTWLFKLIASIFRNIAQRLGVNVDLPSRDQALDGSASAVVSGEDGEAVRQASNEMSGALTQVTLDVEAFLRETTNPAEVNEKGGLGIAHKRMADFIAAFEVGGAKVQEVYAEVHESTQRVSEALGIPLMDAREMIQGMHDRGEAMGTGIAGGEIVQALEVQGRYISLVEQQRQLRVKLVAYASGCIVADPDGNGGAIAQAVLGRINKLPPEIAANVREEVIKNNQMLASKRPAEGDDLDSSDIHFTKDNGAEPVVSLAGAGQSRLDRFRPSNDDVSPEDRDRGAER